MKTLLLDTGTWDLVLDAGGNIAVASDPYSQAQDAASAIKLFEGELWYDTAQGVPYWQQILGHLPSVALMTARFAAEAQTVPGVSQARAFIGSYVDRTIAGQVQIINDEDAAAGVNF